MRALTPNDTAALASLPADVRQEVRLWIGRLESITPPVTAALKERIAGFKVPKRVLVVADLPRNAMGKVQKALMRQTCESLYRE